ncbi:MULTISPECIES: methyltransferase domain-containing protein [Metabacillus]|uniref:Methyltransferase domain-containing protein n=1 Tax=Metabacillus hrfriensis TaxID=3048891 RepID=A0ACD4RAS3_9BACI|nr:MULTISPECIES: methyltransferase domain-containing protein [Metabacillus]UAL52029.1 methyltransferase domain-containing protein [Metabacillus dongyingensis]WHZ57541.1 methyltransferase domain-containing protein [Metabacillus sp. CT-WN-B3]
MSKLIIDRVNEAYYGALGTDFSKKTRERINWIVTHVLGSKVLDIGCSQGINAILLGREGKKVDGIDISHESVEYAKTELGKEHPSVQASVSFKVSNFMTDQDIDTNYDTILLTEVLEHISDPDSFLKKTVSHLKPGGRLIVTVPFGINDFIDHKRTYYYSLLAEQLGAHFKIESFEYLGRWTGVICTAVQENNQSFYTAENTKQLEQGFYWLERDYMQRIGTLAGQAAKNEKELKELEKVKKSSEKIEVLYEELNRQIAEKDEYIRQLQIETVEVLNREEEALRAALAYSNKIEDLNRKVTNLEHRYNVLRKSRFGRVQLKYWELKKKIAGRGKK